MKAKLVFLQNINSLKSIRQTLKTRTQFAQNENFDIYFDKISQQKNNKEPLFAIGVDQGQSKIIKIIYSLHTEYKLTRQLCKVLFNHKKCVHIQEIYTFSDVTKNKIEQFQKDLISQLDCYKVVAINIAQNSVFKPNQKFMTIQNKAML